MVSYRLLAFKATANGIAGSLPYVKDGVDSYAESAILPHLLRSSHTPLSPLQLSESAAFHALLNTTVLPLTLHSLYSVRRHLSPSRSELTRIPHSSPLTGPSYALSSPPNSPSRPSSTARSSCGNQLRRWSSRLRRDGGDLEERRRRKRKMSGDGRGCCSIRGRMRGRRGRRRSGRKGRRPSRKRLGRARCVARSYTFSGKRS